MLQATYAQIHNIQIRKSVVYWQEFLYWPIWPKAFVYDNPNAVPMSHWISYLLNYDNLLFISKEFVILVCGFNCDPIWTRTQSSPFCLDPQSQLKHLCLLHWVITGPCFTTQLIFTCHQPHLRRISLRHCLVVNTIWTHYITASQWQGRNTSSQELRIISLGKQQQQHLTKQKYTMWI